MKIGVLALQGDFALHGAALTRVGVESAEVRKPAELEAVGGLIIPGGESTTLLKLMAAGEFVPALEKFHADGKPIFGTCAGLIVLAREVLNPSQFSLGFIDVTVERNAYGRQKESFETEGEASLDGRPRPLRMVFIRAPRIRRLGPEVARLASHGGECVMARQGSVLVATFHPELTDDPASITTSPAWSMTQCGDHDSDRALKIPPVAFRRGTGCAGPQPKGWGETRVPVPW